MKIALVQYRPAIRLFKWATVLRSIGHHVTVFSSMPPVKGLPFNRFPAAHLDTVNRYTGFDVMVSFNPCTRFSIPDSDIPTVQAIGDLAGMYTGKDTMKVAIECAAIAAATAITYVSRRQMLEGQRLYAVNDNTSVIYNATLSEMIGEHYAGDRQGIVYMGTLTGIIAHHRNVTDALLQHGHLHGYPVHVYPSAITNVPLPMIEDDRFRVHYTVSPYHLIGELSLYKRGIIEINSNDIARVMMPNKLFDYLNAGLEVECPNNMKAIMEEVNTAPMRFDEQAAKIDSIVSGR
ncbi:MAG: hypothetical protein WC871_03480 [Bacteroidales bacterium]